MRCNWKALAILGILGSLCASEAGAQWGPYGRGPFGPRPYRGPYQMGYAPPVVVTPYPYVVNETRYVYAPPTIVTREVYQAAPVLERTFVQPPPIVERRFVQPPPIVERRVIQPAPIVETSVIQPPPVVQSRVIQPPPVEQDRVIEQPPVIESRVVTPSNVPPPLPFPY